MVMGFNLNEFHRANFERQHEAFAPPHPLTALVVCVQEEVGELAAAVLGYTGEKKRKAHLGKDDVLDAVADAMTYLSLVASNVGEMDLETLLAKTFNMVSERAGSKIKVTLPDVDVRR
jgi:NTP pyrophosphatase (non-canonical NTP hydrolase)